MAVREIIINFLKENGYDGLYFDNCGCGFDDFIPCHSACDQCSPAYAHSLEDCKKCSEYDYCTPDARISYCMMRPEKNEMVHKEFFKGTLGG